ncbi:HNH endonuclease signature motif containing protein [Terracoccus sp. 273MFTsu3.1]|uniref:HNH endonuclease signature motif containing protein n=1 Tax=Terracoccus sp. 273MFTsu3.1 TaxID=1172188 RepID=UPI000381B42E|nr:HNH endonuclease signature motif containing protein [Terracoccus sp. 273MFTsu3.1]
MEQSRSVQQIERDWDHVASLGADLHDAHARLVDLLVAVLADGSWQAAGLRSPEHWLMLRAGLSRGQAASIVLLARRAQELPDTVAALREGRISLDQAAVVARHTPAAFDTSVAQFAEHATVTQLQRTVTRYDFTLQTDSVDDRGRGLPGEMPADESSGGSADGPGAQEAAGGEDAAGRVVVGCERVPVEPAHLSMGLDADGRFRLRYDAPAEVGALVEAALAEARDHLFHTLTPDGQEPDRQLLNGDVLHPTWTETDGGRPRITWADAMVVLATRSLDAATTTDAHGAEGAGGGGDAGRAVAVGGSAGRARAARYRVQVHLDTDGGWLTGRPRLPQTIVNGLTCDGTLTPVWETDGHPVNVGRTQRVVPHRTRVLVLDRDRGCRFPGCGSTHHLEIHHVTHWRDGGPTDTDNLLALCPFHHDGHHRGEFTLTGDPTRPDGLTFHTDTGLLIGPPQRPPRQAPRLAPAPDPDEQKPPEQPDRRRPPARLGRRYPAPTGGTLHLHLVDFTPT